MMKSTSWRFPLFAALTVIVVAACGGPEGGSGGLEGGSLADVGEPVDGDWLVPILNAEPPHLNPHLSTQGAVGNYVGSFIFETLLKLDNQTVEPKPHIAKSWEVSDDHLTYSFHLRDDVTFSDGKPLTAADLYQQRQIGPIRPNRCTRETWGPPLTSSSHVSPVRNKIPASRAKRSKTPLPTQHFPLTK